MIKGILRTFPDLCAVAMLLALLQLAALLGCSPPGSNYDMPTRQPDAYGPRSTPPAAPPADAPTLDYDEISGLDPLTVKMIEQRDRNNDLEFRIGKLEHEVRRLNQVVFRIKEIRIGDQSPSNEETDEK